MNLHKAVRFLSRNHEGKGESGIIHSKGWKKKKKKKKSIRNTLPRKAVLQKWRKYRLSQLNKNWRSSPVAPLSSVQSLSRVWLFATPWTTPCQASLSITNSWGPPKPISIELVMPSNHLLLSTSSPLLPSIFPRSGSFQMSQLFASGGQSIGVSASTLVPPMNTQDWFPLGWTCWISLQSKGLSQESSPAPQFKSINALVLSFLYSPTLTFIDDHWKNNSLDYMDLCWQSNVSAFEYAI